MLDGSRFNAAIRPVGVDGPLVSIRKFSKNKLGLHKLVEFGALTQNDGRSASPRRSMPASPRSSPAAPVPARRRCSTRCPLSFPEDERLITIEDAAELQLQQPHVARMETRPANVEGNGELKPA
jgi:pilus assembly protein CpaF